MTLYATFQSRQRLYGIDILSVREIIRTFEITAVPRTNAHIRGLINLRGQVVTILDLSTRLGMPRTELTDHSHIVVLKTLQSGAGTHLPQDPVGLLVDNIADVVEADASATETPPANLTELEDRFLSGVVKTDAGLLVLLNLNDLLNAH